MSLQRNVAQQIEPRLAAVERAATHFVEGCKGDEWLPPWLTAQGLDVQRGILAALSGVPGPGCEYVEGTWVTAEGRFYGFEVTVPADGAPVEDASIADVTASIDIDGQRRGIGATFGFLALQVLARRIAAAA